MDDDELLTLAKTYKDKGGAHGAIAVNETYLLNPWYPSTDDADRYWRENIATIPVSDRVRFLKHLAKFGW